MSPAGCAEYARAAERFNAGFISNGRLRDYSGPEFWSAAIEVAQAALDSSDPVFRRAGSEMTDAITARDIDALQSVNVSLTRQCVNK